MTKTDVISPVASAVAPLANWCLKTGDGTRTLRRLLDAVAGIYFIQL
jgi:hypothetical protein